MYNAKNISALEVRVLAQELKQLVAAFPHLQDSIDKDEARVHEPRAGTLKCLSTLAANTP
jgi:hypothetical protein